MDQTDKFYFGKTKPNLYKQTDSQVAYLQCDLCLQPCYTVCNVSKILTDIRITWCALTMWCVSPVTMNYWESLVSSWKTHSMSLTPFVPVAVFHEWPVKIPPPCSTPLPVVSSAACLLWQQRKVCGIGWEPPSGSPLSETHCSIGGGKLI